MHVERSEPAVLVVDRSDPARRRRAHAVARGVNHLADAGAEVEVAKGPGRVLAQHAGGLAARVADHHAAMPVERRVGAGQGRAVEPQRVVVLGHQSHGDVARHPVECPARGRIGPVAVAPAQPAQPGAVSGLRKRGAHAVERLLQRAGSLEAYLAQADRPGGEMNVGVAEAGQHATAVEIDAPRRLIHLGGHRVAGDRQAPGRSCARRQGANRSALQDDAHRADSRREALCGATTPTTPPGGRSAA